MRPSSCPGSGLSNSFGEPWCQSSVLSLGFWRYLLTLAEVFLRALEKIDQSVPWTSLRTAGLSLMSLTDHQATTSMLSWSGSSGLSTWRSSGEPLMSRTSSDSTTYTKSWYIPLGWTWLALTSPGGRGHPTSSFHSRIAPSNGDSPSSRCPPGYSHLPEAGSSEETARWSSRARPPGSRATSTSPATVISLAPSFSMEGT